MSSNNNNNNSFYTFQMYVADWINQDNHFTLSTMLKLDLRFRMKFIQTF